MDELNKFLIKNGIEMDKYYQSLEMCKAEIGRLFYARIKWNISEKIAQKIELSEKDNQFLSCGIDPYNDIDNLVTVVDHYNIDNPDAFIIGTATHDQLLKYITLDLAMRQVQLKLDNLCKDVHKQSTDSKYHR